LLAGFTLKWQNAIIDFLSIDADIARVDVGPKTAPKAWKLSGIDNEFFREWFRKFSNTTAIRITQTFLYP
jgi:hypothetical protein